MQQPTMYTDGMPIGPGNHYTLMPNEVYHAAEGISKSHLDEIAGRAPIHYWAAYIDPNREPYRTKALDIGQCIHAALLEPDTVEEKFAIAPDVDKRTKDGKAQYAIFALSAVGKTIIEDKDFRTILKMRDALYRHPVAGPLLTGGQPEVSFFATDEATGVTRKCRSDYLRDNMIIDLKSCEDASPVAFGKAAANYRYDVQAPWYIDTIKATTGVSYQHFCWIAIEKSHPYAVGIYYATPEQISRARNAAQNDFSRIIRHRQENTWPDYGEEIRSLLLPGWAVR